MKKKTIENLARRGRGACNESALLSTGVKNRLLARMARALLKNKSQIMKANQRDVSNARKNGESAAFIDRLLLNEKRIGEMIASLKILERLPDPVGKITARWKRPNGMIVRKVRIPLGVVGIIYESRPNVTVDTAAICLKAGNAVILRGGSEAFHSNAVLSRLFREVLKKNGVNPNIIQKIPSTDRWAVPLLLSQDKYIDLIIPRGGEGLMKRVKAFSKIPVIRHDKGVCHLFVDREADLKMARTICINAKTERPSTCNALETLLVDEKIAKKFIPPLFGDLKKAGVEIRGDLKTVRLDKGIKRATKKDWSTEYLGPVLSVKVVSGLKEAIEHIQCYGSLHTESIVTENKTRALEFLNKVLASCVMVNASTRLNDGFQLGLGAEVGISTTKLHAFGPMGLEELTTTKYVVWGSGQIRK